MVAKTIAYLRVSTDEQDLENQRLEIETYANFKGMSVDEWMEVEISSKKTAVCSMGRDMSSTFIAMVASLREAVETGGSSGGVACGAAHAASNTIPKRRRSTIGFIF